MKNPFEHMKIIIIYLFYINIITYNPLDNQQESNEKNCYFDWYLIPYWTKC